MKRVKGILVLVLVLGVATLGIAAEAKRVATMTQVNGRVEVKSPKGKWVTATVGMVLNEGDIIRSKKNSGALLNVNGKGQTATVQLKENSQLELAQLIVDKDKGTQKTLLDLALGEILIKAQKLHSPDSAFEVKTPTSIVGVRGTTFEVSVEAIE